MHQRLLQPEGEQIEVVVCYTEEQANRRQAALNCLGQIASDYERRAAPHLAVIAAIDSQAELKPIKKLF